jgi:peptide/nickel transport system substrate-binding protein
MSRRRGTLFGALVAVILVLGSASGMAGAIQEDGQENGDSQQDGDGASDERVVFTIGDDNDIDSMNPFVGVEAPAYLMYSMNYDLLVHFSTEDYSPSPGLAESWEVSEDGLTWTFNIRQGVKWHDGEPFTAHDVAYTYNRVLEERIGAYISYLKLVETVEAVDDFTLEITTKRPTTGILSAWVYIVPEHIWSEIGKEERKTFENYPNPVGTGPFQVVEWRKGQFFRLEANPDYWGGAPKVDEIVYRIFNNEDAAVQALRNGEIDFADTLQSTPFESLQDVENIGTNAANAIAFDEIGINAGADETLPESDGHPALKDVTVRRAMAHAIDKQVLVDRVLRGNGKAGQTIVPSSVPFYHYEPTDDELFEFDPEQANQLLDDAGYEDTDGDGVREMPGGGEPLRFRYFIRSEKNNTANASQFVTSWLEDVGIETRVQALTDAKLTDVIYEGRYDLFHWGWFPDPDPDFILSVMTCDQRPPDGVWSDSFYCNEQYDEMYLEQKTILDLDERAEMIKEMQRLVFMDVPYIVLWEEPTLQAYRSDRWTGFVQQPTGDGDLLASSGPFSYISIEPLSDEVGAQSARESARGIPPGVWIAIVVAVVALVGLVMFRRSRIDEDDRA